MFLNQGVKRCKNRFVVQVSDAFQTFPGPEMKCRIKKARFKMRVANYRDEWNCVFEPKMSPKL